MNEETFKDEKGTFHYEPVVWGDWKEGDVVVFDGFIDNLHDHWAFTEGESYIIDFDDIDIGPRSDKGEIPSCDWGFKFSRKVYDIVEDLDIKTKDEKWNEYPFSFPPVNTLVLVEYDTVRQEWYKGFVLALGDDADGEFCQFQWLEGPKTNQTTYYYTPESFKPLLPVENKEEEKDAPKQEKSLDNLLKEFHSLKQEEKELSDKIAGIIKDINQILDSCGLAVVYQDDL